MFNSFSLPIEQVHIQSIHSASSIGPIKIVAQLIVRINWSCTWTSEYIIWFIFPRKTKSLLEKGKRKSEGKKEIRTITINIPKIYI
jgi:hypothetical protein